MNLRTTLLVLAAISSVAVAQTTRLVPSQYPTIQAAINACINGDNVLVAPGMHAGPINYFGKAIVVHSSGGALVTTITGASSPGSAVVTFAASEGPASVLDGFTVTGGAGLQIQNTSPVVQNCRIVNNVRTGTGGGFLCLATGANVAAPLISGCLISGNFSVNANNTPAGAGIAFDSTSTTTSLPTITGCVIASNSSTTGASGAPGPGGAISVSGKWNPAFTGCTIADNATPDVAGACFINGGANATFTNCRITGNHGSYGGAFYLTNASVSLTGCLIAGNLCNFQCGALYSSTSGSQPVQTITIRNCTITGNLTLQSVGGVGLFGSNLPALTITSSILWGNVGSDLQAIGNVVTYSDVGLGLYVAGQGTISADPRFLDQAGGDFHLATSSPCKNAGAPGNTGLPSVDLDGAPRIAGGTVDMGADEVPALSFPGTPDGLDFYAQINGTGDPLASVRSAAVGSLLSVRMKSTTGSLVGGLPLLAARIYFTGNPFAVPGGGIWMDGQSIVFYGALFAPPFSFPGLPPEGLQFDFTIPAGLTGQTVRMQGLVTSVNALNGIYATSNATEVTF